MASNMYIEDNISEFGVEHHWANSKTYISRKTKRGTHVEIIHKPLWGLTCYMDNSVQSCIKDERIYHDALVHPLMACISNPKRVCIIGGGEGATLREVLKWPTVEEVDMYEWDKEVVELFKNECPQWSKGAFEDKRVVIIYDDIFEVMNEQPVKKYDAIIVDLFEPTKENNERWKCLLSNLSEYWIAKHGSIVMYAGMRNILSYPSKQPYELLIEVLTGETNFRMLQDERNAYYVSHIRDIIPYKVFIPSFTGESTFILLKNKETNMDMDRLKEHSHISEEVWNSYRTFNW